MMRPCLRNLGSKSLRRAGRGRTLAILQPGLLQKRVKVSTDQRMYRERPTCLRCLFVKQARDYSKVGRWRQPLRSFSSGLTCGEPFARTGRYPCRSDSVHNQRIGDTSDLAGYGRHGFCVVQPIIDVPAGEQNQDHKLGIVLPHGENEKQIGEYLKAGQFLSGYAKTKHPKEVAMFIDFMVNDPEATAILGSERECPSTPAFVSKCNLRCLKRSKPSSSLSTSYPKTRVKLIRLTRRDFPKWIPASRVLVSRSPSVKAAHRM